MERATADWQKLLDKAGVPCSPILDVEQVMQHPHVQARGMLLVANKNLAPPMVANPMLMDGHRMTAQINPPVLDSGTGVWIHSL
jgi:crotonobetainyl-CoA:carnitine CoA-transferase CaiB-like acyl-CoA transferase